MSEIKLKDKELERLLLIKQVQDRKLTQKEASKSLGISDRQIRRLLARVKTEGCCGIKPRQRGGNRAFKEDFKEKILSFIHQHYADFGPTFASEKLESCHGLKVNRETLRGWMIEEGLWKGRSRKKARVHQSRERRSRLGELVQIDGSHHDWFESRAPKCCLLVFCNEQDFSLTV
ncbi:MAG TPA: helix-turn-helix domain-containing protein [Alphaproteobacteria bacterium]|nr:helix-turn-helix domain-containing protein [Alphaproteobacteria bacterium]